LRSAVGRHLSRTLDRLVHNAYRLDLAGDSLRRPDHERQPDSEHRGVAHQDRGRVRQD